MHRAIERGHRAIVKLLLKTGKVNINWKDKDSWMPLSWAVEKGRKAIVKLLLKEGKVDIDSRDKNG